jgi:FtsP/CotA-like multicopper oxidase with cupredoxin domain
MSSIKLAILLVCTLPGVAQIVTDPPEVCSPVALTALNDPKTGRAAFASEGKQIPPVIRAARGESIRVTYKNTMSAVSHEKCATGPCMNMTNLHFHGLHVSPKAPQDDVITMMAMPGESLEYTVEIPRSQPPGLYWYHTHPHGESYRQALDGMSGAIVIEGMDAYVPEVRNMRERILVLRDQVLEKADPEAARLRQAVEISSSRCGGSTEQPERIFTINGAIRPTIPIAAGERQFWRIVNASPDMYADLQIDGQQWEIVALDGMPLSYHDPKVRTRLESHVLVPPGGRLEAIVTGPRDGAHAKLRTLCFDTGPDGDPNPTMALADLAHTKAEPKVTRASHSDSEQPVFRVIPKQTAASVEAGAPEFTATFTEDKQGFYINGKPYHPDSGPMIRARVGGYHRWRVVNRTHEAHPFHIHQVHFLFFAENDKPLRQPQWLDTVNVPIGGSVDLVMDFSDPIIRGMSVFHCHLLNHEDKGMMAKILFE